MLGSDFRGFADAVTHTYGDDPWFFLRELAQNSRDAGARCIRVTAETTAEGTETVTFADDGRGMTLAHARHFLFRLYASDKGRDPSAAGCYGIGFWTILRFQPHAIHLQSRHGSESWAFTLDAELNARPATCLLTRPGTIVVLTRPAASASADEFSQQVEVGLRSYCRYLRRNDRRGSLLPLWFAGKNLTEPMSLPGPLSISFRSGPVEGAVGLGKKPEVRLFARGLPVWRGTVLGQMSHLQADADIHAEVGDGLAPVFLLNGNHLDVTFSRTLAVENKALDRVRKKGEAALRRLLATSLEATFPRTWHQKLGDRLQTARAVLRRPGWHWLPLILLLLVPVAFTLLRPWFPAPAGSESVWFSLRAAPMSYRGAVVAPAASAAAPPFFYSPGDPALFRLFAADMYDARSGFIRLPANERRPLPQLPRCPPVANMRLELHAESREIFLPLAVGHVLFPGSLRFAGRPLPAVFMTVQGETIAQLPAANGWVEYGSCSDPRQLELAPAATSRFLALASGISLPAEMEAAVRAARSLPVSERVELALALVRETLLYETSSATAESYRQSGAETSWLTKVLRIGRGDCDVLNGLHVLLLRKMGVPARLVIGMVGAAGRARPRLHAWGEYFDRGWQVSDATLIAGSVRQASSLEDLGQPRRSIAAPETGKSVPHFNTDHLAAALFIILLPTLTAGAYLLLRRRRRRFDTAFLPLAMELKIPLLQIAEQALLQPARWGADNPIWRHRLLPTVDGACVSLQRAQLLQRQKKLFMTANRNPLALAMAASGITVLDLSQSLYAPWRTLWEGAIDSDLLCRLRPEPPAPGAGLLATLNALLKKRWRQPLPVLLAPGLSAGELLRVSLPAPLRDAPFYFPQRFIAVAPAGKIFPRAAALYRSNPPLAVLRLLRRLHESGVLDGLSTPRSLKNAARLLLVNSHG